MAAVDHIKDLVGIPDVRDIHLLHHTVVEQIGGQISPSNRPGEYGDEGLFGGDMQKPLRLPVE
ncbi:MAG: hypothetical protein JJE47_02735 [Acidimicrobiia bacterium]|nr:hypothetical protein [Acidimicrobiia bacterium]